MSNFGIFDRTTNLLEKALNFRQQNQQVIASNVANVDTPGHVPARLEFEENLKRALNGGEARTIATHKAHFPLAGSGLDGAQAKVVKTPLHPGSEGEGVQLEQEMMALAENQILYEAASQIITKKLGLLKYIAQDGK